MNSSENKCVMVIDEALPLGITANTAAILGTTLGKKQPEFKEMSFNTLESLFAEVRKW